MNAKTHLIVGQVVILAYSIYDGFSLPLTCLILLGCILPDLDNPRSMVSAPFFNLSSFLYYKFGHRTLLHSPLLWFPLFAIADLLNYHLLLFLVLGAISHVSVDMFTTSGVMIFPFKSRAVWNKALLVTDADTEVKLFFVLLFIVVVLGVVYVVLH